MNNTVELLEGYCERIIKELHDLHTRISKSDVLSTSDLDTMDKLLHSLKSAKTVHAMAEHDDGYTSVKKYVDPERDDVVRRLEGLMSRVRNDNEAIAIRDAIDTVNRLR